MKTFNTRKLTFTAAMLALATILAAISAVIPFMNLPFGGGFTLASSLPIIIVSYVYGVKHGLYTALVYAFIQIALNFMDGQSSSLLALFLPGEDNRGLLVAISIVVLDYFVAYVGFGLGGIFRKKMSKSKAICLGVALVLVIRYITHTVSGAIFYGSYASWFFTETVAANWSISKLIMENLSGVSLAVVYSIIYNACYMIPEIIIAEVAATGVSRLPDIKMLNSK